MKPIIYFAVMQICQHVASEIRDSVLVNKLKDVKPVGGIMRSKFVPLTEIPPPRTLHFHGDGRRHLDPDCKQRAEPRVVYEGPQVDMFGDYYDEKVAKTVATIIIPDHIDHKHFEVTTQVPYLTLGTIEGLGYHPSTIKGDHPSECEKIYQDHLDNDYTEEDAEASEESLEMARMPLFPNNQPPDSIEARLDKMYSDMEM